MEAHLQVVPVEAAPMVAAVVAIQLAEETQRVVVHLPVARAEAILMVAAHQAATHSAAVVPLLVVRAAVIHMAAVVLLAAEHLGGELQAADSVVWSRLNPHKK